jgi:maleylacetoacetate isomerase
VRAGKKGLTAALEALLKQTSGGKFCFGDSLTLADVAFVPQMYTVLR